MANEGSFNQNYSLDELKRMDSWGGIESPEVLQDKISTKLKAIGEKTSTTFKDVASFFDTMSRFEFTPYKHKYEISQEFFKESAARALDFDKVRDYSKLPKESVSLMEAGLLEAAIVAGNFNEHKAAANIRDLNLATTHRWKKATESPEVAVAEERFKREQQLFHNKVALAVKEDFDRFEKVGEITPTDLRDLCIKLSETDVGEMQSMKRIDKSSFSYASDQVTNAFELGKSRRLNEDQRIKGIWAMHELTEAVEEKGFDSDTVKKLNTLVQQVRRRI